MRTYEMKDGVLTCIVEARGYCGSLKYDFLVGEMSAHKPENMSSYSWFWHVNEFLSICRKMVKPKPDLNDDF